MWIKYCISNVNKHNVIYCTWVIRERPCPLKQLYTYSVIPGLQCFLLPSAPALNYQYFTGQSLAFSTRNRLAHNQDSGPSCQPTHCENWENLLPASGWSQCPSMATPAGRINLLNTKMSGHVLSALEFFVCYWMFYNEVSLNIWFFECGPFPPPQIPWLPGSWKTP